MCFVASRELDDEPQWSTKMTNAAVAAVSVANSLPNSLGPFAVLFFAVWGSTAHFSLIDGPGALGTC